MSYTDRMNTVTEELGGTWVGTWAIAWPDWAFYDLAVIKAPDGAYISTDSGCSCPTPFESHQKSDFTGPLTVDQVIEEYTSLVTTQSYDQISPDRMASNIVEIKEALA